MCENERIVAPSSTVTPGPEHDVGLDRDVAAELGVGREEHGFRRHQRDAGVERRLTQALLDLALRGRKLRLAVDAAHFVLHHFERDRLAAPCARAIATASVR